MFNETHIASIIRNQFPEFARDEYPGFINFLKLYYTYLDQSENRNLDSYRDIDETLDVFIDKFKTEMGLNIPTAGVSSDRFILKHIKDLYSAKGTEEGFRILFRYFFNQEIEIKYPQENILRASDGRWNQDVSIVLSSNDIDNNGSIWDIVGKHITISSVTQSFTVYVNRIKTISGLSNYEVFLAPFYYGNVSVGDIVTYESFKGTIQPAVNKITVTQKGSGFYIGQLLDIDSDTGTGTRVKVTKVDSNGGILSVQIIRFGTGYATNFYATVISGYDTQVYDPTIQRSNTGGFIDYGHFTQQDYFSSDYLEDYSYTGTVIQSFYNQYTVPEDGSILNNDKIAILVLQLGALQKYPGYFTTSNGFLSDSMYLEDNHYYQIYSYVLKVNESIEKYRNIVKALLHPAGLALFGEYTLNNYIDLSATIRKIGTYFTKDFADEVFVSVTSALLEIGKSLSDTINISELMGIDINKGIITETLTTSDSGSITFNNGYFLEDYSSGYGIDPIIVQTF